METQKVIVDKWEAKKLYHAYLKNKTYDRPEDEEIKRTYRLISEGRTVIQALASIKQAGVNSQGLPKLAIAPAAAEWCLCKMYQSGAAEFSVKRWPNPRDKRSTFSFPAGTFPRHNRNDWDHARAMIPIVPPQHRPKRALENYHILWEAEWERIPPKDPYLLQRLGKGDLWLVLAAWDLTSVEQAAMATRVFGG